MHSGFREAKRSIEHGLAEEIDLTELALDSGLSQEQFEEGFTRSYGKSPEQYRNDARIGRAANLLLSSELSLLEVCLEAGFCDLLTFKRLFKRTYGVSPRCYRRSLVMA